MNKYEQGCGHTITRKLEIATKKPFCMQKTKPMFRFHSSIHLYGCPGTLTKSPPN